MKFLQTITGILLTVITPLLIIIISVRVLLTPLSIQMEYHMPGFPPDTYGFTTGDRQRYAKLALDYLFNAQGIEFLGNQTFPDGTPLYNERELSHMEDVKNLFQSALRVGAGMLLFTILTGVWAWRAAWMDRWKEAISRGGWITVGLVFAVILTIAISFNWVFTKFHNLFFQGDSWLFLYSDTLIRLFPQRLWQDCFIGVGILALLLGFAAGWFLRRK